MEGKKRKRGRREEGKEDMRRRDTGEKGRGKEEIGGRETKTGD